MRRQWPWLIVGLVVIFSLGFLCGRLDYWQSDSYLRDSLGIEGTYRIHALVNQLAAIRGDDTQMAIRSMELELLTQTATLVDNSMEWPDGESRTQIRALGLARAYLEMYPTDYTELRDQIMPHLLAYKIPAFQSGVCWPATRRLCDKELVDWRNTNAELGSSAGLSYAPAVK